MFWPFWQFLSLGQGPHSQFGRCDGIIHPASMTAESGLSGFAMDSERSCLVLCWLKPEELFPAFLLNTSPVKKNERVFELWRSS